MDIPIRKIVLCVGALILFLGTMQFFPEHLSWTVYSFFHMNRESNFPTWCSSLLLYSVALAACGVGMRLKARREPGRSFWFVFSFAYLFMSLDESTQIHELVDQHTRIKWVYAYAPGAAMFFLYCVWWLTRRIPQDGRAVSSLILGGMMVFALGAMGFELVDYLEWLPKHLRKLELICEEGLEMAGTTLVLAGCCHHLNRLRNEQP